jgi:uncharacterized protein (DUF58 family)
MSSLAVAHTKTVIHLGPAGRVALPVYLMGSLVGWATGGVGMLFPAFGSAVWLVAIWYALRQSDGVQLRALNSPPHWTGDAFLFDLELSTRHRRTLRDLTLCLRSERKGHTGSERPNAFLARIQGGHEQVIPCGYRHLSRGQVHGLKLALFSLFPLALLRVERHFELPVKLLAWPRLGAWRGPAPASASRGTAQHQQARQQGLDEFYQLSPWRAGMSRRHLHWKLSARRGRPLQQELEAESEGSITVELLLAGTAGRSTRSSGLIPFETAVALTATLVDHHLRKGRQVDLVLRGNPGPPLDILRGRAGRTAALNALALVQPFLVPTEEFTARLQASIRRCPAQLILATSPSILKRVSCRKNSTQLLNVEDPSIDTLFRRAMTPLAKPPTTNRPKGQGLTR